MFQQDLLKDRAIFLTGGGTGLGRSMALHFAMLGARMFLVGRREQPLKEVCDEIHRGGGAAAFATCDVRDYGAVETVANLAYEQFGRIDTVVNNAAGNFMARTEKLHNRLLRPLLAADQPQAPAELRAALRTIDQHINGYITQARLSPAA